MDCPKCRTHMQPVSFDGFEVDRCTDCHGIWFDAHEAQDLRARKGSEAIDIGDAKAGAAKDSEGKIECPRCGVRMVRMVDRDQPHIWYECCSICHGTFFDAGEFRDLKERTLSDMFRKYQKGARPLT
jgi:Zn-finger nucleic acid-binding protein